MIKKIRKSIFRMIEIWENKVRHGVIKNVEHTKYKNHMLMSYITNPFRSEYMNPQHVNIEQSIIIAKAFSKRGYNVDVIDFNNESLIDLKKYDIVFGFGNNFDRAAKEKGIYTIAYLTGANPYWSNLAELKRLRSFEERTGKKIRLRRQAHNLLDMEAGIETNAAICTGNGWTKSTFEIVYPTIQLINNQGLGRNVYQKINRDINGARKRICYFAGSGNLHKGLDLVLEAMQKLEGYELYIAGGMDDDFCQVYGDILAQENIHLLGKINVESEAYLDMCTQCLFSILPSCSEGQASSITTCMYSGLIPIVSLFCGIDIEEGVNGFLLEALTADAIVRAVEKVSDLENSKLEEISGNAWQHAMRFHSLEGFEKRFNEILEQLLGKVEK